MSRFLTEEFPKPISINIRETIHSFTSYAKFKEWAEKQKKFFESLGDPNSMKYYFQERIIEPIDRLFQKEINEEYSFIQLSQDVKSRIEGTYQNNIFLDFANNEGKWLTKQLTKNPSIVKGAVEYFQTKYTNPNNNRDGEFAAYLFDKGYNPDFDAEKQKYDEFYKLLIKDRDHILYEYNEAKTTINALLTLLSLDKQEWEKSIAIQKTEITKRFDDEYSRHELKMKESEEFYEKKLAVKNAVVYWNDKAKEHKRNSWIFGLISGALMIGTVITIICIGNYFLSLDLTKGAGARLITKSGALQLWVYGFFIITVTMITWIIRILVKVFLSNLHHLSDAKERATMIMTYLAFEREEEVLKPDDRELILPSIFRTSSHGIIKEDSAPQTPMNFFMGKS